jgi:hypothetical protein
MIDHTSPFFKCHENFTRDDAEAPGAFQAWQVS